MTDTKVEEKILKAAKKEFVAKGRGGARMQAIADEAGVNKALIHYYFRSKDQLFQRALDSAFSELMNLFLLDITKTNSFKEMLMVLIDTHCKFFIQKGNILNFLLWEIRNDHDVVKESFRRMFDVVGSLVARKINEAVKKGEIRRIDAFEFILNLLSLDLFFLMSLPVISSALEFADEQVEILIENRKREIFRLLWQDIKK